MSEQHDNILRTIKDLARDLDALGWDQPSRIYHLVGDENDPTARLAGVMPTYPPTDMQAGFDQGMRVASDVLGLVVANEGYRHLYLDEVLAANPLMQSRFTDAVHELQPDLEGAALQEAIAAHYHDVVVPNLPSPGQMPPFMRAEMRTVAAVLRDGTTLTYGHTRGKEDDGSGSVMPADRLDTMNVPKAMYLFINGVRPDIDCENPRQRVEDHKTLEFLSNLPTTED